MQPLNPQFLSAALSPYKVICFDTLDSTNQYLLNNMAKLEKGTVCLAEQQTAGRGRRGRTWQSPFGSQIIFSLNWSFSAHKPIEGLSCIVGLAIAETLRLSGAWVAVKWPNDILLHGKKLAGILIEVAHHQNGLLNLVIGAGINLALPKNDTDIEQAWINLTEVVPDADRNKLSAKIIQNVIRYLTDFELHGITPAVQRQWMEMDAYFGDEINIITAQRVISGTAQGIDEKGCLQLVTNNGEWLKFNGGEVSLRKA